MAHRAGDGKVAVVFDVVDALVGVEVAAVANDDALVVGRVAVELVAGPEVFARK